MTTTQNNRAGVRDPSSLALEVDPSLSGRCKAKARRTGERCRRLASLGGAGVCVVHGAGSPKVKAANARRLATAGVMAQLRILSVPEEGIDPTDLLLRELGAMAGDQTGLRKQLESMPPEMLLGEARGVLDLYLERQQRLVRASEAAARLGLETRTTALAEQLTTVITGLVMSIVVDVDLSLTSDQRARVQEIMSRQLMNGVGMLTSTPSTVVEVARPQRDHADIGPVNAGLYESQRITNEQATGPDLDDFEDVGDLTAAQPLEPDEPAPPSAPVVQLPEPHQPAAQRPMDDYAWQPVRFR